VAASVAAPVPPTVSAALATMTATRLPRTAVAPPLALAVLPKATLTAIKLASLPATAGEATPTELPPLGQASLPCPAFRRRLGRRRGLAFRPLRLLRLIGSLRALHPLGLLYPLGTFVAFRRGRRRHRRHGRCGRGSQRGRRLVEREGVLDRPGSFPGRRRRGGRTLLRRTRAGAPARPSPARRLGGRFRRRWRRRRPGPPARTRQTRLFLALAGSGAGGGRWSVISGRREHEGVKGGRRTAKRQT
jgi:hypothetical protein